VGFRTDRHPFDRWNAGGKGPGISSRRGLTGRRGSTRSNPDDGAFHTEGAQHTS